MKLPDWLDLDFDLGGESEDPFEEDIGAVSRFLDSRPIYASQVVSSLETSYDLDDVISDDRLELENNSVKRFHSRNRDESIYRESKVHIEAPAVQVVVPHPSDIQDCFGDNIEGAPVYLRTAFENPGEVTRTENVYALDTQTLDQELVNLKHITPRSGLGETGIQQVVSGNNLLEEAEEHYRQMIESEY